MHDEYEIFWEYFSDQLSCLLDIIAKVERLHPDTVGRIHLATVEIYRQNLEIMVGTGALPIRHPASYSIH